MDRDNNRGMRDWLIFIRTAEKGSLSETARQLDMSTAAVSKSISRFERYLDTVLFTRTSQGMKLTEAGFTTLARARDITVAFHALLEEIRNPEREIKGAVRLAAPAIVCEFLASEWCHDYTQAHPHVRVFLDTRERTDLRSDSPELDDVVLRSGRIESEDLVHRKLSPVKLLICASPDYLKRHPAISHPSDLERHTLFGMHNNGLAGPLMLSRGEESYLLESSAENGLSSNNLLAMFNLALKGKGISLATPGWLRLIFRGGNWYLFCPNGVYLMCLPGLFGASTRVRIHSSPTFVTILSDAGICGHSLMSITLKMILTAP